MHVLISAAVCPHPPLLVTGIGPERDNELDQLRDACWSVIDALRSSQPDVLVVVGSGKTSAPEGPLAGSFATYGVDRRVAFPGHEQVAAADMPLSLCVGAWLLERDGWPGPVVSATVAGGVDGWADSPALGLDIVHQADRVALLVMTDGSASRAAEAPRTFHPRAAEYDAAVCQAIRDGDPQQLLDLDGTLAAEVGSTGANVLRAMAGAASDEVFDAEVLYDSAPYGVGYLVGLWERHG